jgi:4-aminobutyrate aminotransferase-like enzyme
MQAVGNKSLRERRDEVFGSGALLFYNDPVEIVRGEGVYLFDGEGTRYIDMYNNVPCVGHANPHVADAVARQQAALNVHSRYLHEGIIEFAERLVSLHDPRIESVVFSCSGTEANEVALQLARTVTGRRGVICSNATYHGNSEAVIALTRARDHPEAYPEIRTIPFPDPYRPIEPGLDDAALRDAYLARLRDAIDSLEQAGVGLAAVIFCSIFANEGLPDIPSGFMARAAEMVRAAGGLVIADEVQAGYGRSGHWWGYQQSGFEPDVVVTGKPMGNGVPLAATAASKALVDTFRGVTRYFNTCASTPLQAAAGMAVLDVIEDEGLVEASAEIGGVLKEGLSERVGTRDWIGDVRGPGLFLGVDLVTDPVTRKPDTARAVDVVERLKNKGFLTSNAGAHGNVVKIRPPLVITAEQAKQFLEAFDAVVAEVDG